jgi:hypothetical protein
MNAEALNPQEAELAAETKSPEPVTDTPIEVEERAYAGDQSAIEDGASSQPRVDFKHEMERVRGRLRKHV